MTTQLLKELIEKIYAHLQTTDILYINSKGKGKGFAYLCYICGVQMYGWNAAGIPNLTVWERNKLKSLLDLFCPTPNELIDQDRNNANLYEISNRIVDMNAPITFSHPWWGYYDDPNNPTREYAFWLILAMLEEEAGL